MAIWKIEAAGSETSRGLIVKKIRIVITAAGAPQAATLIRYLRTNSEFPITVIGVDMNSDVIGRHLVDEFYLIPSADSAIYDESVLELIENIKPDAILNCSENDLPRMASLKEAIEALGTKVLCSSQSKLEKLTNKRSLYEKLRNSSTIEVPDFRAVNTLEEFVTAAESLGFPKYDVCFKPPVSKGSRGFRILSNRYSRRELLLEHKPIARYLPLEDFISIFEKESSFPELLVMEMVEGAEHDVMSLGLDGDPLLTSIKTRESARWGVIDRGELVNRPDIRKKAEALVREFRLDYNVYMQFIGGKLIEASNRTSTYIFQDDLVEPWEAIKLALDLTTPDDVRAKQTKLTIGRRMIRYMDQVFFDKTQ